MPVKLMQFSTTQQQLCYGKLADMILNIYQWTKFSLGFSGYIQSFRSGFRGYFQSFRSGLSFSLNRPQSKTRF